MNPIQVIGWYGKKNAGDEAYKLAFPALFNCSFVFSDVPKKGYSAYVLGGGDILSPTFLESMSSVKGRKIIASVAFPEKVDRDLFQQFEKIIVRDKQSVLNASKNGVNAILAPDFAFALKGDPKKGRSLLKKIFAENNADLYEKVVGVVLNSHLMPSYNGLAYESARFDRFCYEIAQACDATNASVVFIPFGKAFPWDDRAGLSAVASRCKFYKKNVCVYQDLSVEDTLDLITSLDCLVSMRLHSTIFAVANSIPFLDITHNHKNKNMLETLSLESSSIPYKEASSDSIKHRISHLLRRQTEARENLRTIAQQQVDDLRKVTADICF